MTDRQTKFTLRSLERGSLMLAPINTSSQQNMLQSDLTTLKCGTLLVMEMEGARTVNLEI